MSEIPQNMQALWYNKPHDFQVKEVAVPDVGDEELLLRVEITGLCGTDAHIHEGEFISKFPLIPGHEAVGKVVAMGKNVTGFSKGDRVVADVGSEFLSCFPAQRSGVCEGDVRTEG